MENKFYKSAITIEARKDSELVLTLNPENYYETMATAEDVKSYEIDAFLPYYLKGAQSIVPECVLTVVRHEVKEIFPLPHMVDYWIANFQKDYWDRKFSEEGGVT